MAARTDLVLEEQAALGANAVSIISSPMREFTRRLRLNDEQVLLLRSGAGIPGSLPDRARCREELGVPSDALVLGYVANITPDNRLLEGAFDIFREKFPVAVLLSAGPTWFSEDGPVARAAEAGLVKDLGRIPFAGIGRVLAASDFLLLPMRDVPFNHCRWPNKIGDYLAAGRFIAATRVGDAGRAVGRWKAGAVGEPTAEGLAGAMMELAAIPDRERQALGHRAREVATGELSWNRRLRRLIRFLRKRGLEL